MAQTLTLTAIPSNPLINGREHETRKAKLTALFFVRDCILPYFRCAPLFKAILLLLASYANPDGTRIFQSSRSIAALLGCERSTVQDALKFWRQTGVLVLVKAGNGRGHANEYRIDLETECTSPLFGTGNGVMETPFQGGNGVGADGKGSGKGGGKRGAYATTTESPNTPKQDTEENHQSDDLFFPEVLISKAENIVQKQYPQWKTWQVQAAIWTVFRNAYNSGITPRFANYFVVGVANLTKDELNVIEDFWTEESFGNWLTHTKENLRKWHTGDKPA